MIKPFFPTTEGLPITSPYGWRTHPISGLPDFHAAIDISGLSIERPVFATQKAKCILNQYGESTGWYIRLEHIDDNYYSQYLHLATASPLTIGQVVERGQIIGVMGTTGDSTGIHLDFAVATSASGFFSEEGTIDPEVYLEMKFEDSPDRKFLLTQNRNQFIRRRRLF